MVPLTEREEFNQLEYELAYDLRDVVDPGERRDALGAGQRDVTLPVFEADVHDSSDEFCRHLADDLRACLAETERLVGVLQDRCGKDDSNQEIMPSPRKMLQAVQACLKTLQGFAGPRLETAEEPTGEEAESAPPEAGQPAAAGPGGKAPAAPGRLEIASRQNALEQLRQLADFFQRTEPHSPVSYHIREAVKWCTMALPELLKELITDEKALRSAFIRVGIEPPQEVDEE
jgi:type VI secretion system protein ImpA